MKKIIITEACFVKGEPVSAGEEINVDLLTADSIIAAGKGRYAPTYDVHPKKADEKPAEKVEQRDPNPDHRDPPEAPEPEKPAAKGGKKN